MYRVIAAMRSKGAIKGSLHWRFLLRFQARFGELLALEIAAESPGV